MLSATVSTMGIYDKLIGSPENINNMRSSRAGLVFCTFYKRIRNDSGGADWYEYTDARSWPIITINNVINICPPGFSDG